MRYAYVTTNLLDMWANPTYDCERVNQILWGEPVEPVGEEATFARVKQPDGYEGWVDARFLAQMTRDDYHRALTSSDAVVSAPNAMVFSDAKGTPRPPYILYYGTKLRVEPLKSSFVKALLPDGSHLYIKKSDVRPIHEEKALPASGGAIVDEAKRFLGVPYLWGGITDTGFDCSGFVRTVFSTFGIYLPRDTKDQIQSGDQIELENVQKGDLLFFRRHVAIVISEGSFIHSSRGGGGVRINSLDPSDPDFRDDLAKSFNQARRVI